MLETGKPAAEVARDLGVHEGTLQTWVSRARGAAEAGTGPLDESEREELARNWPGFARRTSGCVRTTSSWGWSAMSSSAAWSCG
ncbi:transposase [Streptomyces sp. 1222.5]|uniref:transposase n=1 Tax=Streptomyces sp. 1222.5 TaxID=1881026 RepID=UPI003EBE8A72